MSARRAAVLGAWTVLVAAFLVALPPAYRGRLPDPMATHWSGLTPDAATSLTRHVTTFAVLWLFVAALFIVLETAATRRRPPAGARGGGRRRRWCGAVLGGVGALFAGVQAATVGANLGRGSWHDARIGVASIALPLVAGVACGVAGGWLDTLSAPPEPAPCAAERPVMDLAPGERVAWTGQASSPAIAGLAVAFAAVGVVCLALTLAGPWRPPPGLTVGALILGCLAVPARIRVTADRRGLRVAFGPFGWPVQRIALERITAATVEDLRPIEVGGWGYRGLPGNAAIMLRGGPCLIVRYNDDRNRLVISVDDPEPAAAVLNSLRHHAPR